MARILLVDDEPTILNIFRLILTGEGHEVRTTEMGEEAIQIVEQGGIDLLISDVRMGPVDGFEVLRRSRALQADLPVLLVSAYNDADAIARGTELGALAFLAKPLASAALIKSVNDALGGTAE